MDLRRLYETTDDKEICKLCGFEYREHDDDCPGAVLENSRIVLNVSGPNCGRQCCGYTNVDIDVDPSNWPKAIDAIIDAGKECLYPSYRAFLTADLPCPSDQIKARKQELEAIKQAREERAKQERREKEKADALASLELEREDLTAEAYARRRAAIEGGS